MLVRPAFRRTTSPHHCHGTAWQDQVTVIGSNWITIVGLLTILLLSGWASYHGSFDRGDFDLWAFDQPGF